MATQLNRKRAYEPPSIPDRLYFKIGDVAELCGVETYVLRFWESQFPQLKPNKSGTGQRLYRRRDVELALEIKRLVHAEGYTLAGARAVLEQEQRRPNKRSLRSNLDPQNSLPLAAGREQTARRDQPPPSGTPARNCVRSPAFWALPCSSRPRRRSRLAPIRAASGSLFPRKPFDGSIGRRRNKKLNPIPESQPEKPVRTRFALLGRRLPPSFLPLQAPQ